MTEVNFIFVILGDGWMTNATFNEVDLNMSGYIDLREFDEDLYNSMS